MELIQELIKILRKLISVNTKTKPNYSQAPKEYLRVT